jgi:hypothetical protein
MRARALWCGLHSGLGFRFSVSLGLFQPFRWGAAGGEQVAHESPTGSNESAGLHRAHPSCWTTMTTRQALVRSLAVGQSSTDEVSHLSRACAMAWTQTSSTTALAAGEQTSGTGRQAARGRSKRASEGVRSNFIGRVTFLLCGWAVFTLPSVS